MDGQTRAAKKGETEMKLNLDTIARADLEAAIAAHEEVEVTSDNGGHDEGIAYRDDDGEIMVRWQSGVTTPCLLPVIATGYVVQDIDGNAIHGIGATADEAWSEVVEAIGAFTDRHGDDIAPEVARETQFCTYEATEALLNAVREHGGAIAWRIVDGVADVRA